jgi:hypothetical protein
MAKDITNLPASVHQKLLNKATENGRPFNELLQYFAMERFLYRLSKTPHASKFILKGALMFTVWGAPASRPTKDIDLLGRTGNDVDEIVKVMKDACKVAVEPDGMSFDDDSVVGGPIAEDADYQGVRVTLRGALGNARVSVQIDIGFGDVISPRPTRISYPTILDFPAPKFSGYSKESAIAEKFQAMVKLGMFNSRMKDFYDIWLMSRMFDFKGQDLAKAIEKTFKNRDTAVTAAPQVFDKDFCTDKSKQTQWKAFLKRTTLTNVPEDLCEVVADIRIFLGPILQAIVEGETPKSNWRAADHRA